MAGLFPATHAFLASTLKNVDARHKAGHDGGGRVLTAYFSFKPITRTRPSGICL